MIGVSKYFRDYQLLQEINIEPVIDVMKTLTRTYEYRLHDHPNIGAIELLADQPVRRLNRKHFTKI